LARSFAVLPGLLIAGACALAPVPAFADAIDGDWCNGPASLRIEGPAIHTPGGKDMTGDYDRHAFHYIVPAGEKDAGADVMIQLMNDYEMVLVHRIGGADGPLETWKRCQPVS
jgi:hypothetical protein